MTLARSTDCVPALLASALLATSGSLSAQSAAIPAAPFNPPAESDVPRGPLGDSIRLGEKVISQTQTYAKAYVGNDLNCTSCHLNGGKIPYAGPLVCLWGMFPEYRSRNAKVNALQERINDCFRRSMNGKPLPMESDEMVGVLAYVWWQGNTLTDKEAFDVAAYFTRQPRPDFAAKSKDWPVASYYSHARATASIDTGQYKTPLSARSDNRPKIRYLWRLGGFHCPGTVIRLIERELDWSA